MIKPKWDLDKLAFVIHKLNSPPGYQVGCFYIRHYTDLCRSATALAVA